MVQGFKSKLPGAAKRSANPRPTAAKKQKTTMKKGARVIKPKRAPAVVTHNFKQKLETESIKQAEEQTVAKLRKPSGETGFKLVKPPVPSKP